VPRTPAASSRADAGRAPDEAPEGAGAPLLSGLRRNAASQFGARAVGIVAQGLALILVARRLGPAEYGAFALVSSLTLMATVLADWGLLLVGARAVATRPEEEGRILRACLSLRLLLGLGAMVLLIALAFAGSDASEVRVGALVAGLSFIPGAWFTAAYIVAQVDLRLERAAIAMLLGSVASTAYLLVVLELGGGIVALSASFPVATLVSAVAGLALTRGRVPLVPRWDGELARRLLRESTPVAIGFVFVTVYFYVDALLLARLSSTEQLGLYDSAYRFVQLGPLIPNILVTSVFAIAARHAARDRERLRLFVREFVSVIALLAPLPLVLLATAPGDLIDLIYGPAYADAAPLLAILATGIALMMFSGVVGPLLVALGRERTTMIIAGVAAALNIAANLVLIPLLDARGAAIATVATELCVLVSASAILQRELHPRLDGSQLAKVAAAALAAAATVWLLGGPVLVRLAAGLVVYLALLVASGAASRRQLELTRSAAPAVETVG
jgi:O-antigen/teichoic acid export membrane protein